MPVADRTIILNGHPLVILMSLLILLTGLPTPVRGLNASLLEEDRPLVWTIGGPFGIDELEGQFSMGSSGSSFLIVQFQGPLGTGQREALEALGARVLGYFPDDAYVIHLNGIRPDRVRSVPGVIGTSYFWPGLKASPDLGPYLGSGLGPDGPFSSLRVLTFIEDDGILGELTRRSPHVDAVTPTFFELSVPVLDIEGIARIDCVSWLEPVVPMELKNDVASGIIGVDTVRSIHGLDGTGQTVGVADSGCDTGTDDHGTALDMHADLDNRVTLTNWAGSSPDDFNGHGTHVVGSVAGNGASSGGSIKGMAPNASVFFQGIMTDGGYLDTPSDLRQLFGQAYSNGSRVHTNSWGASGLYGDYTTECSQIDDFTFRNPQMLILFAAGNDGWDSNSDGKIDTNSVSPPATAKNCLTVGASENFRGTGGIQLTYGQGWGYPQNPIRNDRLSNNSRGLAAFSGRGPVDDGRIKPDVVAPGTNILSLRSSVTSDTGWGLHSNPAYMYNGGTSMSTPITAGTAALVRDHYTNVLGLDQPSGALVKATLINGASDLTPGQYGASNPTTKEVNRRPDIDQGWGRVDLEGSLHPPNGNMTFIDNISGLRTGDKVSRVFRAASGRELRLTLAWSDYPGAGFAGKQLVNDLDLVLESPSGTIFLGNDLTAPFDDQRDATNNVETISITDPEPGWWMVTVNASSVPMGTYQHFALVASGDMSPMVAEAMAFSKPYYSTDDDQVWLTLTSRDLLGSGTITASVNSTSFPAGRSVTLTEEGGFGSFRGYIRTSNVTTPDPLRLYVRDGDAIFASFMSPSFMLFTARTTAKSPLRVDIVRAPDHYLTYTKYETVLFTGIGRPGTDASFILPGTPFGWQPLWDDGDPTHNDLWVGDGTYGALIDIEENMSFTSMLTVRVLDPFLGVRDYPQFNISVNTSLPRAVRALRAIPLPDGNKVFLSWDRSSSLGLSHYSVYLNGSPGSSYEDDWYRVLNTTDIRNTTVVDGLTDGIEYGFRVAAVNMNGNSSSLSVIARAVPADVLYPQVELVTPPMTLTGSAVLEFDVDDDTAVLEVDYYNDTDGNGSPDDGNDFIRVHSGPAGPVLWDTRSASGGPGDMKNVLVRYRGFDEVPNISPFATTAGFSIDNTGPMLLLVEPAPSRVTNIGDQTFVGYTEPRATVQIYLNEVRVSVLNATSTGQFDIRMLLAEGPNTIVFRAFDRFGAGPLTLTYPVTLDTQAPVVGIAAIPSELEIMNENRTFTSNSTDRGTDPEFTRVISSSWNLRDPFGKERTWTGESFNTSFDFLGDHVIQLTVTDMAGNSNSTMLRFRVKDTIAPLARVNGPLTVDEDSVIRYTSDGSTDNDPNLFTRSRARHFWYFTGPLGWNFSTERTDASVIFPEPGEYTGELSIIDSGGNVGNATVAIQVRDRTPPFLRIRGEDRFRRGTKANFTFEITDNGPASVEGSGARWELWFMDGPSIELVGNVSGTDAWFELERAGNHTLRLFARDEAGNLATAEKHLFVEERTGHDGDDEGNGIPLVGWIIMAIGLFILLLIAGVTAYILVRRNSEIVEEEWEDEEGPDEDYEGPLEGEEEALDWEDWE